MAAAFDGPALKGRLIARASFITLNCYRVRIAGATKPRAGRRLAATENAYPKFERSLGRDNTSVSSETRSDRTPIKRHQRIGGAGDHEDRHAFFRPASLDKLDAHARDDRC